MRAIWAVALLVFAGCLAPAHVDDTRVALDASGLRIGVLVRDHGEWIQLQRLHV